MGLDAKKITPNDVFITNLTSDEQKWSVYRASDDEVMKNRTTGNEFIDVMAECLSVHLMRRTNFYESIMQLRPGVINQFTLVYSGITFKQWRDDYIMLAAKELLLQTDYGLDKVGKRLGFSGISTFSRWFINIEKESASSWRRMAKHRQAKDDAQLILKLKSEQQL